MKLMAKMAAILLSAALIGWGSQGVLVQHTVLLQFVFLALAGYGLGTIVGKMFENEIDDAVVLIAVFVFSFWILTEVGTSWSFALLITPIIVGISDCFLTFCQEV